MTNRCSRTGVWPLVSATELLCWLVYSLKDKWRKVCVLLHGRLASISGLSLSAHTYKKGISFYFQLDAVVSDMSTVLEVLAEKPNYFVSPSFLLVRSNAVIHRLSGW